MLGPKIDAQKYYVDFEVKNDLRKIKFVDECYWKSVDYEEIMKENRCITIPKGLLERLLVDGKFNVRFIIKGKNQVQLEETNKEEHSKQQILKCASLQTQQEKVKDILRENLTNTMKQWKIHEVRNEKNFGKSNFSNQSEHMLNNIPSWRKHSSERVPTNSPISGGGNRAMPSPDFSNKFADKIRNKRSVRPHFRR